MAARLPFSNRYVFAKVMQDNPELCKEMIERILGIRISRIEAIEVESEAVSIEHRGVRFDVFVTSDTAAFEVEMQTYEQRDLPLRMRYYRSQLDRRLLAKGEAFDGLRPVYVIFICIDDPFGFGLPVYTFKSLCMENPDVPFDNGALDLVLNASGDMGLTDEPIAKLLEFVRTGDAAGGDELTEQLAEAVDDAFRDEEWVNAMSWLEWDIRDAKAHAAREGRAEGLAEGLAEGRAEGLAEGRAEGRAAGLAEGRAEGHTEGHAEGLAAGRTEGLAEGESNERARQTALLEAMRKDGRSAEEIVAALSSENVTDLYNQYGIS